MSILKASGPVGKHRNKRVFSVHLKHNPTRIVHVVWFAALVNFYDAFTFLTESFFVWVFDSF